MSPKKMQFFKALAVGFVLAVVVAYINTPGHENVFGRICDGCFVSAVMLLGVGGLLFARNQGTFDVMSYGISTVFHMVFPMTAVGKEKEDFPAYRDRKAAKRNTPTGLLMAGLVYLILALLAFLIYYLV